MKNQKIIQKLLDACITNKPSKFLPYLYFCRNVEIKSFSKWGYYRYLIYLLNTQLHGGEHKAVGKISIVVEPSPLEKLRGPAEKAYCFYDEVHTHMRMYILIAEQPNKIVLDLFPS